MGERSKIVKMITLISQIGITMLSSIFLCGIIGYLIDQHFGTHTFIVALLLGIAGGYRAVYSLVKQFIAKDKPIQTDGMSEQELEEWKTKSDMWRNAQRSEEAPEEPDDDDIEGENEP